jgi:hypothetical protein
MVSLVFSFNHGRPAVGGALVPEKHDRVSNTGIDETPAGPDFIFFKKNLKLLNTRPNDSPMVLDSGHNIQQHLLLPLFQNEIIKNEADRFQSIIGKV